MTLGCTGREPLLYCAPRALPHRVAVRAGEPKALDDRTYTRAPDDPPSPCSRIARVNARRLGRRFWVLRWLHALLHIVAPRHRCRSDALLECCFRHAFVGVDRATRSYVPPTIVASFQRYVRSPHRCCDGRGSFHRSSQLVWSLAGAAFPGLRRGRRGRGSVHLCSVHPAHFTSRLLTLGYLQTLVNETIV